jgi:hypothetical protein
MYGSCERCKALGQVRRVGTIDPQKMEPKTVVVCAQCEKLYWHMNHDDRRKLKRDMKKLAKHGPNKGPRGRIQPKPKPKPTSPIIIPEGKSYDRPSPRSH